MHPRSGTYALIFATSQKSRLAIGRRGTHDLEPGFYIYVCDLLVHRQYRGRDIGRQLMEPLLDQFPDHTVYVMSDVDEYYKKLGYELEGSIFKITSLKKFEE